MFNERPVMYEKSIQYVSIKIELYRNELNYQNLWILYISKSLSYIDHQQPRMYSWKYLYYEILIVAFILALRNHDYIFHVYSSSNKILNFIEYANRINVVEGIRAFARNNRLTVLCFLQYLNYTTHPFFRLNRWY